MLGTLLGEAAGGFFLEFKLKLSENTIQHKKSVQTFLSFIRKKESFGSLKQIFW